MQRQVEVFWQETWGRFQERTDMGRESQGKTATVRTDSILAEEELEGSERKYSCKNSVGMGDTAGGHLWLTCFPQGIGIWDS